MKGSLCLLPLPPPPPPSPTPPIHSPSTQTLGAPLPLSTPLASFSRLATSTTITPSFELSLLAVTISVIGSSFSCNQQIAVDMHQIRFFLTVESSSSEDDRLILTSLFPKILAMTSPAVTISMIGSSFSCNQRLFVDRFFLTIESPSSEDDQLILTSLFPRILATTSLVFIPGS